jgi:hypothetical protein
MNSFSTHSVFRCRFLGPSWFSRATGRSMFEQCIPELTDQGSKRSARLKTADPDALICSHAGKDSWNPQLKRSNMLPRNYRNSASPHARKWAYPLVLCATPTERTQRFCGPAPHNCCAQAPNPPFRVLGTAHLYACDALLAPKPAQQRAAFLRLRVRGTRSAAQTQ